jgi:hypothetical protein
MSFLYKQPFANLPSGFLESAAPSDSCFQAAKAVCRIRSEVVASAEALLGTVLCVFIGMYCFFCRLAVSSDCNGFVYNL